jgi:hypothetical protein
VNYDSKYNLAPYSADIRLIELPLERFREICDRHENYDAWSNLHEALDSEQYSEYQKELRTLAWLINQWETYMDHANDIRSEAF